MRGADDTRAAGSICAGGPCIWGTAEAHSFQIKFSVPQGYRVRILTIRGDLISWIKSLPGDRPTPLESTAGVLMGFTTTAPSGSVRCDWCADNTSLYIQDAVTEKQPKSRTAFNYENVDQVLEEDHTLNVVLASWLNSTGKAIHMEPTYTIKFAFEPAALLRQGALATKTPIQRAPLPSTGAVTRGNN